MEAKDGRRVERPDDLSEEEREVVLRVIEVLRRIEFGMVLLVVQGRQGGPDRDGREVPVALIPRSLTGRGGDR